MNPMYVYLERLRRSGIVNMFGAGAYLARKFGLEMQEANKVLFAWMDSYNRADYEGIDFNEDFEE